MFTLLPVNYFASIGKDMADSLPDVPGYEDHLSGLKYDTMWLRPLEEEEVGEIMKKQQPKMSCGIDTFFSDAPPTDGSMGG